ncbi:hypothetical protein AB0M46_51115, partial [Dactylosporangium sp. NPDC051485]|uniref:hypothetical protein n=1 Tax=Dactylosporangium sp. NPDC051485 TaxID=3154846 RepID=UPI0034444A00
MDNADEFCRLACLTYTSQDGPQRWEAARRLLHARPDLTREHIWAASAAGRDGDAERLLAADPGLATRPGGPFGWRPLSYLAYSRVGGDRPVDLARRLLAAGADPDEGQLFGGLVPPFTALTGLIGHGERGPADQPRHPRWRELARLLLAAGADPNDGQALYNTMFAPDDEPLQLLFEFGLGRPHDSPWRRRLGERLATPEHMLRTLLRWAVEHDQRDRVRLLAEHGVDVRSPFTGDGPAWAPGDGSTPVALARLYGNESIVDDLIARGAPPPAPDPVADLIAAAFRADPAAVAAVQARHPG